MSKNLLLRVRQRGWWPTLSEMARTLVPTPFDMWERALTNELPSLNHRSGVNTLVGAVEELARLRRGLPGLPADFFRDEIDGARGCVVAEIDGYLAGVAWGYDESCQGHFLRMGSGEVELRSVYSLPEFRRRGVARTIISEACRWFAQQGYQRMYAVIHANNVASQRAFEAAGFRKIAALRRPALFGPRYLTAARRWESWFETFRCAARARRR